MTKKQQHYSLYLGSIVEKGGLAPRYLKIQGKLGVYLGKRIVRKW